LVTDFLSKEQKAELKASAEYAKTLPPIALWEAFKEEGLSNKVSICYQQYWFEVGTRLEAYFGDLSEPLPSPEIDALLQELIQTGSYYYQITGLLIYQSERLLKKQASDMGLEYPFEGRSDLLKILMLEDCLQFLELLEQECYQSLAASKWLGNFHTGAKCLNGEISLDATKKLAQESIKDEEKLKNQLNYHTQEQQLQFWNTFCLCCWYTHREELKAYKAWVDALDGYRTLFTRKKSPAYKKEAKFAVVRDFSGLIDLVLYPGRGEGQKKSPKREKLGVLVERAKTQGS
jgi:hypothetical protein